MTSVSTPALSSPSSVSPPGHIVRRVLVIALVAAACGCSTATTQGTFPRSSTNHLASELVFVMPPRLDGQPTGNIGRDLGAVEQLIGARVLAIVREREPSASMAGTIGDTPYLPMKPYIDAVAPARVTREELNAAGFARQHGGTHLVVPTIIEWREMRTDDPIGALTLPHAEIMIGLRLVRLDSPAVEGQVTFKNHARVTVNQSADRLLNSDFRRTVLRLVTGDAG